MYRQRFAPKIKQGDLRMKKLIALSLALAAILTVSVPAFAFTSADRIVETDIDWTIDVIHADYDQTNFGGNDRNFNAFLPSEDRGYLKNETVGAIVTIHVPKEYDDNDVGLEFGWEGVEPIDIVPENDDAAYLLDWWEGNAAIPPSDWWEATTPLHADGVIEERNENGVLTGATRTFEIGEDYSFLVIGHLIEEGGSITAHLVNLDDSLDLTDEQYQPPLIGTHNPFVIDGEEHLGVWREGGTYYIEILDPSYAGFDSDETWANGAQMRIKVDSKHRCTEMQIALYDLSAIGTPYSQLQVDDPTGVPLVYEVTGLDSNNYAEYSFVSWDGSSSLPTGINDRLYRNLNTSTTHYKAYTSVHDIYTEMRISLGLSITQEGYLYDSFFVSSYFGDSDEIHDTVVYDPYVEVLTVPTLVVDPPKTGDAFATAGIVMAILALAGTVVLTKIRA